MEIMRNLQFQLLHNPNHSQTCGLPDLRDSVIASQLQTAVKNGCELVKKPALATCQSRLLNANFYLQ